ncbi:MAG: methyltransferase domain-containing protein [Alphaproteobacteria bacterium]|jgi:tRNA (cmo5U34)-methyltransferase|nr:methyltransferase domain-containing protein [Alphaproteobacteria bacterium]
MKDQEASEFFGDRAEAYEDFIPRLVPFYHEINRLMLDLIPYPEDAALKALDVGTGTGVVAGCVLAAFPNSTMLAIDLSPEMLEECAENLGKFGERATVREGRFPDAEIGSGYDVVVSSLALHHLSHEDKRASFAKIYAALKPGGIFLLRDVVLAPSQSLDERYNAIYRQGVAAHGYDDMSWFDEHLEQDNPAPVPDQLQWLRDIGYTEVSCHWSYLTIAMFGGQKPS